jgi:ferredoxin
MSKIIVTRDGIEEEFECDNVDTILEASQEAGVDIPFGCTSGNCHMCLCQIIEGEVDRQELDSLNKSQRDQGLVLVCQAKPKSDSLKLEIKG